MTLRIETNNFYTEGGGLAPLWLTDEKDKFEPRVKAALEQIRSTEVGSSLLRAIEGAGQEVLIVKGHKSWAISVRSRIRGRRHVTQLATRRCSVTRAYGRRLMN